MNIYGINVTDGKKNRIADILPFALSPRRKLDLEFK